MEFGGENVGSNLSDHEIKKNTKKTKKKHVQIKSVKNFLKVKVDQEMAKKKTVNQKTFSKFPDREKNDNAHIETEEVEQQGSIDSNFTTSTSIQKEKSKDESKGVEESDNTGTRRETKKRKYINEKEPINKRLKKNVSDSELFENSDTITVQSLDGHNKKTNTFLFDKTTHKIPEADEDEDYQAAIEQTIEIAKRREEAKKIIDEFYDSESDVESNNSSSSSSTTTTTINNNIHRRTPTKEKKTKTSKQKMMPKKNNISNPTLPDPQKKTATSMTRESTAALSVKLPITVKKLKRKLLDEPVKSNPDIVYVNVETTEDIVVPKTIKKTIYEPGPDDIVEEEEVEVVQTPSRSNQEIDTESFLSTIEEVINSANAEDDGDNNENNNNDDNKINTDEEEKDVTEEINEGNRKIIEKASKAHIPISTMKEMYNDQKLPLSQQKTYYPINNGELTLMKNIHAIIDKSNEAFHRSNRTDPKKTSDAETITSVNIKRALTLGAFPQFAKQYTMETQRDLQHSLVMEMIRRQSPRTFQIQTPMTKNPNENDNNDNNNNNNSTENSKLFPSAPVRTREEEEEQLREPNVSEGIGERQCRQDENCEGMTIPDAEPVKLKEFEYIAQIIYRLEHNGTEHLIPERQLCVMCSRRAIDKSYISIRSKGTSAEANILCQNYSNIFNQQGQYDLRDAIMSNSKQYQGIPLPVVKHQRDLYFQVTDQATGRRSFHQNGLKRFQSDSTFWKNIAKSIEDHKLKISKQRQNNYDFFSQNQQKQGQGQEQGQQWVEEGVEVDMEEFSDEEGRQEENSSEQTPKMTETKKRKIDEKVNSEQVF